MKNNKVYMAKDAIERHEDFSIHYPDGDVFMTFKGPWEAETDKIRIFGRMGGEMGNIKADVYKIGLRMNIERYEYTFRTIRLFKHYYVKGMLWDIYGSLTDLPFNYYYEGSAAGNDVRIREHRLAGLGDCYEIKVADVAKLRIAAASVVAMAIKEHYRGLSEGENTSYEKTLTKLWKRVKGEKGKTLEELEAEERLMEAREAALEELRQDRD